jgi:hypothetical protein
MNTNNQYGCFIRRSDGNGWVEAQPHHRAALEAFELLDSQGPIRISVPHPRGGNFVATFYRVGDGVSRYEDEYGGSVEIMMAHASYAAYINRIVDY